jgi:hypothetical protein
VADVDAPGTDEAFEEPTELEAASGCAAAPTSATPFLLVAFGAAVRLRRGAAPR